MGEKGTDFDIEYYNASHDAMDTAPHAPNAATVPDAENNMFVRQLLDGQEYPVAKVDIDIGPGFHL